jgi:hypothetical protein
MELSEIKVPEGLQPVPMVTCVIEGILEEEDLRELALGADPNQAEPEQDDPTDLKRIKERHHSVARMLASGLTQRMVASLCGYTESYLSVLLNNPAMQELCEFYRIQNGNAAQVMIEKLRSVGLQATEKLEQKLADDQLNNQELIATAKLGLDRGGLGPASKQHIVTEEHHFDHAELQRLNRDARTRNAGYIVPASQVRGALTDQSAAVEEVEGTIEPQETQTQEHSDRDLETDAGS